MKFSADEELIAQRTGEDIATVGEFFEAFCVYQDVVCGCYNDPFDDEEALQHISTTTNLSVHAIASMYVEYVLITSERLEHMDRTYAILEDRQEREPVEPEKLRKAVVCYLGRLKSISRKSSGDSARTQPNSDGDALRASDGRTPIQRNEKN